MNNKKNTMSPIQKEGIQKRLKSFRNHLGKSQNEIGDICKIGRFYYGNIERGQDNYSDLVIIKIAEKLNIDPVWLLHGSGISPIPENIKIDKPELIKPICKEKRIPIPEYPINPMPVIKTNVANIIEKAKLVEEKISLSLISGEFTVKNEKGLQINVVLTKLKMSELIELINDVLKVLELY